MTGPQAPPGWYPNPSGHGQRFWNGQVWAAAPAPQPPQRKGNAGKIIGGLIGAVLLFGVIGSLGDDDDKKTTNNSSSTRSSSSAVATSKPTATLAPPPVVLPRVGQEVRDGKFAFVVTSIDRSKVAGDLTNQFMQETAQGEFINVRMTVTNVGEQPQTFFATNQKLTASGRQYEADDVVSMWTDSANVEINPGNSIEAVASFDVPPGTVPDTISLHDSMFSGGVAVQL